MGPERLKRLSEVAMVLVLLAGTGYLAKQLHHNYVVHGPSVSEVRTAPKAIPTRDGAGERAVLGIEHRDRPLMLLVLRTTCPFCEENMPNWDLLADEFATAGVEAPELVVLSVSSPADTRAYLARHGLDVEARYIDPAVLPLLGLEGYPSTVAVDPQTRSLSVWDGVLQEGDQDAIRAWAGLLGSLSATSAGGGI